MFTRDAMIKGIAKATAKDKAKKKETMKKQKSLTNDLFGIELITCPNCMGEGEIDETPKNATYELYEDCDICKGTGEINA